MKTKGELCALAAVALAISSGTSASETEALDVPDATWASDNQCAPANFADLWVKVVVKAWRDEAFKQQLLANPAAALKTYFNYDLPPGVKLEIVEVGPGEPRPVRLALPPKPREVLPDYERIQMLERFMFPC